jgi:DNA recombination protein RmuC
MIDELMISDGEKIGIAVAVLLLAFVVLGWQIALRSARGRSRQIEERVADLARVQSETAGRVRAMGDLLASRQTELARLLTERLDAATHRIGQSVEAGSRHTGEHLRHLHERLAVIDGAQKNLGELSSQVVSLREILANKQARGAFGQGRMEAIVRDGLPSGSFAFQATLSNKTRPDCVVFLPGDARALVIDAKFPLEAVTALREARHEDARIKAAARVRADIMRHVSDIAEKYLIPGETQDIALMFVPSESVYAELYEGFDDIIQKAYRAQVVIVSPSLLMLAIQVMQQIVKDARMHAAAQEIRTEVGKLMDDMDRLRERVLKLQQHFAQGSDDLMAILISAEKIAKRGGRIDALEFADDAAPRASRTATAVRAFEAGE